MLDLEVIEQRIQKLKPGWGAGWLLDGGLCKWSFFDVQGDFASTIPAVPGTPTHERVHGIKDFIVFAPTDVSLLIAEVRRLREELKTAIAWIEDDDTEFKPTAEEILPQFRMALNGEGMERRFTP